MHQRPWPLILLAGLHFLAPIGNVIFNAIIKNENVLKYLIHAISPTYIMDNWVLIFCPLLAGYAIYACKKWSFYVYLVAIGSVFLFSIGSYLGNSNPVSILALVFVFIINVLVVSYVLLPAVRNIYFDRRMRWWEIQPRFKCHYQCDFVVLSDNSQFSGVIGNISENGLFIRADELPEDQSEISIEWTFKDGMPLRFKGKVIIHDRVDAVGFGVQFIHSSESQAAAKELVKDLETKGMRISPFEGRPEDRFTFWLRNFLTTGKGLFPKSKD